LSALTYVAAPTTNAPVAPPQNKAFDPGCARLPFEAIKMKRPIDSTCPRGGSAAATNPTGAQAAAAKGKPDLRCNSITAEISPHFRPAVWDKFDSAPYRPVFQKYPVRITGTLLFDAAHRPCTNSIPSAGNPVRISVWEIHPVYAIDVCRYTTLARCKAGDQSAWIPFDQYQIKS
jgi:hypothetical protein